MSEGFKFRSDMTVKLISHVGDDASVVAAARVSTVGAEEAVDSETKEGLINFLMKNRHGTPFEHNSMTFLVEAPIAVFREWHRHRIGWGFNEESGRYKKLEPVFYIPSFERKTIQTGKAGHYIFHNSSREQHGDLRLTMAASYKESYKAYESILSFGIAREVARMTLPVGIYSSMFATCNARSLMAFLSLRTKHEGSKFPSFPMEEIAMCAELMEKEFAEKFPVVYKAFCDNGRVCP